MTKWSDGEKGVASIQLIHHFIDDVHLCDIFFSLALLPRQSLLHFSSLFYFPHSHLLRHICYCVRFSYCIVCFSDAQYQFPVFSMKRHPRIFVPIQYWTKYLMCSFVTFSFLCAFHNSFSFRLFNILLTSLFHFSQAPDHHHHRTNYNNNLVVCKRVPCHVIRRPFPIDDVRKTKGKSMRVIWLHPNRWWKCIEEKKPKQRKRARVRDWKTKERRS